MSKFMKPEEREQQIQDLMLSVRRNTQGSKCIDVFEILLNEISDKEVVDAIIVDTHRFISEFSRLCRDVDNMKNLDYIARILTYEFIQPQKYFYKSHKLANLYLLMSDILKNMYNHPVYEVEKKIVLPNINRLGQLVHKTNYTPKDVIDVTKYMGDLSDLSVEQVKEKMELARLVVLIYNYLPAIVKAFIQTKRRTLNLDKNSKMFN
jgi:hypothetical protein